jgi:chorismate-pyruvate lyase
MEQTSTWQTQGEIAFAKLEQDWIQTSNSLTSALAQIWDQSKVVAVEKIMEVEQITHIQMEEMMKVSNQLQLDATNYWDQYKMIAVDKYADFE